MDRDEIDGLVKRLGHWNGDAILEDLSKLSSGDLADVLDCKSKLVGDTAADILASRDEAELLVRRLINDKVLTVLGRVRVTNILTSMGLSAPGAIDAYVHVLDDRNDGVFSNGLFGIVFMRRRDLIPELQKRLNQTRADSSRWEMLTTAIDALAADDPSVFSPGFCDTTNVWRLDERRK
ncbi:MAG TPA: hypothetical protein VGN72_12255 [Tepidisphaeraceae bacterium]|jgi:hypothetical protein|nr:hypothetical protein [Tepidisphaeraceae bacterium]